jgi:hypothetical protein
MNEIKSSNHRVDPTLLNARESAIRARQGAGHP